MKAIRTKQENPKYREWVVFIDDARTQIGTCTIPELFGDNVTLDLLFKDVISHPDDVPLDRYELVDVEIVVPQDTRIYTKRNNLDKLDIYMDGKIIGSQG